MSRKDFCLIANVLRESFALQANVDAEVRRQLASEFADALRTTNPRFDRERFISAACEER